MGFYVDPRKDTLAMSSFAVGSPYVSNYGLWKPYQRMREAEAEFFFILFSVKSYLSTFSKRMKKSFVTAIKIRAAMLETSLYRKRNKCLKISFVGVT
jgi:hypothetical protein